MCTILDEREKCETSNVTRKRLQFDHVSQVSNSLHSLYSTLVFFVNSTKGSRLFDIYCSSVYEGDTLEPIPDDLLALDPSHSQ